MPVVQQSMAGAPALRPCLDSPVRHHAPLTVPVGAPRSAARLIVRERSVYVLTWDASCCAHKAFSRARTVATSVPALTVRPKTSQPPTTTPQSEYHDA